MSVRKRDFAAALTVVLALSALGPDSTSVAQTSDPQAGGVFRVGVASFDFTSGFDPTGEYLGFSWAIFSNLLVRTLVTYRHVAGAEGTELVPDLATEIPEPTDDGLTYTFHLKDGVRFGPPVDREITSTDIAYTFARINCEPCFPQYRFYYEEAIKGITRRSATRRPQLGSVSGIETPDEDTIVFHLKRPVGDFLHRLALPAAGPIPWEVARCFFRSGRYGGYVISSGPYMGAGSEALEIDEGCGGMEPIAGLDYRDGRMNLVRNPNYDPVTDSTEVRENFVDRFRFVVVPTESDLHRKVENGKLEVAAADPYDGNKALFRRYQDDPELRDRLHSHPAERTWYVMMNLTQRPFDDIHVRRALNLALDKHAMREAWFGELVGEIATHVLPPLLTGGSPSGDEYDPYATEGQRGDPERARQEMSLSRYDGNGDGVCDIDACRRVKLVARSETPWVDMEPFLLRALRAIGITADVRHRSGFLGYTAIQDVSRGVPISFVPGWGKDYPDPATFVPYLFDGRRITCEGNFNYSLVGATERVKERCDATGNFADVPNVDAEIDRCWAIYVGDERDQCWVELDERLMEEVVPWVPYVWGNEILITGPAVTKWEYDQFAGETAFSHVAVDPSQQR